MKFLRGIVRKTRRNELETHTLGNSSRWRKYRTKLREVYRDGMDILKEWISIK
jgi:hypothetical protein